MNIRFSLRRMGALAAIACLGLLAALRVEAQVADIADVPLANSPSTSVLPNLMYILDDSGSMNWNYMPDQIFRNSAGDYFYHCKVCKAVTVSSMSASADTITASAAHGAVARSSVVFTSGTPPAPLALGVTYYVRAAGITSTVFKLETAAGVAIDLTGNSTGASFTVCSGPGGGDVVATPTFGFLCANSTANAGSADTSGTTPTYGDYLFYSPAFNKIWYNPDITYSPAVDSTGLSLGNSNPTAAKNDYYTDPTTINLVTSFKEVVFCNIASPAPSDFTNTGKCRFNGRHNSGAFLGAGAPGYFMASNATFTSATGSNAAFPSGSQGGAFVNRVEYQNSNPHYYQIVPNEYCSDQNLTSCALATSTGTAPDVTNVIAAPVRWCKTMDDAQALTVVSGNSGSPATARCKKKFDKNVYQFARFGRFVRVDIVPATASYPKSATAARTDCASAASCTYVEELQNFANWYSYYRERLSLMKTSTGKAFLSIDDRFRVGFITINPNNPVTASKYLAAGKFDPAQRASFYSKLYAQVTNGGTPLREALSRIGRYYGGVTSGINSGMGADPVQYSCQTNYSLLTTDGYWNGTNDDQNLTGGQVGNQDNANSGFTTRAYGAYDGNLAGASSTLADVAAYYYKTDLRTTGTLAPNNVPTNSKDVNSAQHMVTFTLGLGLEGFMDYIPNYETSTTGDFARIKTGAVGCSWTTLTCDWPVPAANDPSTLDDLWHAAVNGRGSYFSASDPNSLALGLQSALAQLRVQTAAASASATSSPNITQTDNFIFSSTFRTGIWDGEVVAQRIDTVTGNVLPAIAWSAQALLDGKTTANSDSRVIFTINESGAGKKKDFKFASLTSVAAGAILAEQPYFANKCGSLAQCPLLTVTQQAIANSGANIVDYLRGQRQYETFTAPETIAPFRTREHVLGDPINATPAYIQSPNFRFADAVTPTYQQFQTAQDTRQAMLYVASNDGYLHGFNGDTGDEMFAYTPRITMPNMARLATANWGATHKFSVDGSPQIMDAYWAGNWHTVLIAGLNGGGRGYYALDITNPANPTVLWEICSDATLCLNVDADMGFSFGNAVIAKRAFDGRWVVFVTSGINNITPGTGVGFLYTLDIATGAVLSKVSTGFGSVAAPSGLNRISGFADDFSFDNTAKYIYGGDLWGNLWKFDTSTATPTVLKLTQLKDGSGKPQSITTRPELATINGFPIVYVGTGRYIGEDDLQDPATLIPAQPFAYQNSLYAIKDKGTTYANFRSASVVVNTLNDLGSTRTTSNNTVNWNIQDGWYMDFNPGGTSPGERMNLDPQLVQGTLLATTNVPSNTACTVGGDSWIYQFDYKNGTYVSSSAGNVAGQKQTGQITVGVVVVRLPSGVFKGISTGATGTRTTFSVSTGGLGGNPRRISWRELFSK
ncbi:MAG: pilus assembly protein [Usitatibacter sp.]